MENDIINAISMVGFPIVACCALFYLLREIITKITTSLDKQSILMDQQTGSMEKQTAVLEKLNCTIDKLELRLDVIEHKINDLPVN